MWTYNNSDTWNQPARDPDVWPPLTPAEQKYTKRCQNFNNLNHKKSMIKLKLHKFVNCIFLSGILIRQTYFQKYKTIEESTKAAKSGKHTEVSYFRKETRCQNKH